MYREYYKKIGDLWKDIVEAKKPLDPVGQETKDIDNDGDHDKSDKYLHNRRKAIKGAIMKKEEVEQIDEVSGNEAKWRARVTDKHGSDVQFKTKRHADQNSLHTVASAGGRFVGNYIHSKKAGIIYSRSGKVIGEALDLDEANIPSKAEIRKVMAPTKNADQAYAAVAKKFNVDPKTARKYVQMIFKDDGFMKEALDLDTKAVDKALTHDCAKHVTSEKWGHGECLPGQHTIVEGEDGVAYVTHYDVMFEHGIEFDVPVEELDIVMSESHKHTAKKMAKEETNKVSISKDYAKHYKKATKPEKYGDTNSEGEKKFAAMHDFDKPELVYDDEAGHTDATKAGKITKKSSHPGNLHIGHKNFGD